jgi:hypothetical protein
MKIILLVHRLYEADAFLSIFNRNRSVEFVFGAIFVLYSIALSCFFLLSIFLRFATLASLLFGLSPANVELCYFGILALSALAKK